MQPAIAHRLDYQLDDRYNAETGRVFLSGTQALVRVLLDQARRDRQAGLNTAGFVSGYRGSPLGALDRELWRQAERLADRQVRFLPAVNEDLAATAMLGSQQVESDANRQVDAVFGLWYGKGPGVDRSGDALKHGNAYGSSPHGGVLVVAGDDHGCVSSSMPHQSDAAFLAWFMPVLNPSTVAEYLQFGEYGFALSRFSGMWAGFKAISETVESAGSVELQPDRQFDLPEFNMPSSGLHYRWPDLPGPQIEERMEHKKHAVLAFADANPIDHVVHRIGNAVFGFVSTGKAYLDLMEALRMLGLDASRCRTLGIDIYKVGMVWPLARNDALAFVSGKHEVVIVEEKRAIIESQLKEYFYDWPGDKPGCMVGKHDENGARLVPWTGELSPRQLLPLIAARLHGVFPEQGFIQRAEQLLAQATVPLHVHGATRTPYFCSGCPHNTSTKVPEGSRALAGIGCHFMASWMNRNTSSLIQMGGEGVNWVASSLFTSNGHIFQNLGEGTWYHSGSMAIRQAIAAGANITYKILFNHAVAMTGGQPVDGPVSVQSIAHICRAEGVDRIVLISDEPEKFRSADFPSGVGIYHRHDLDSVQRDLRKVPGVSILIYEQACATEKRRHRKAGSLPDPARRVIINELVCEGCGDCSVASNCLSVEPIDTAFGKKRKINQSSCNKDFSCINGFCPSFITLEGDARIRKRPIGSNLGQYENDISTPALPGLHEPYDLLVSGVGGTGVVTVAALISMAAHLDNKGVSVLDYTGFAQKFGAVLSYIRLGDTPGSLNQARIDEQCANAVIACDSVVASSPKASACYHQQTRIVLNTAAMPTGDLVQQRDADLRIATRQGELENMVGKDNLAAFDANTAAEQLLGDAVYANMLLLGYAWQSGYIPVSLGALHRAIELNSVSVEKNRSALLFGRIKAWQPSLIDTALQQSPPLPESLQAIVEHRSDFLADYQNQALASRYRHRINRFASAISGIATDELAITAARSLFKLIACKDEYEVARLHSDAAFLSGIKNQFEGNYTLRYHLAAPFLTARKDERGRPLKRSFGPVMLPLFKILARLKGLRGTLFDPFGYLPERKMERELITWFEQLMSRCEVELRRESVEQWQAVLALPMDIRGYGPVKTEAAEHVKTRVQLLLETIPPHH